MAPVSLNEARFILEVTVKLEFDRERGAHRAPLTSQRTGWGTLERDGLGWSFEGRCLHGGRLRR